MSGIACASDSDHTIYQLSSKIPLAIAVNSYSPIPWDTIVNSYKRLGEPEEKENFEDYAKDFESFISTLPVSEDYSDLSMDDSNIIIMGYGKEDLFSKRGSSDFFCDQSVCKHAIKFSCHFCSAFT